MFTQSCLDFKLNEKDFSFGIELYLHLTKILGYTHPDRKLDKFDI